MGREKTGTMTRTVKTKQRTSTKKKQEGEEMFLLTVRCVPSLVERMDTLIEEMPMPLSRNTWIVSALLEAIEEQESKREKGKR